MIERIKIDLNADLGEGAPFDSELLKIVSSANIACGGHAGNAESMRATAMAASKNDVRIGAHPSYADVVNFGRLSIAQPIETTIECIVRQIAKLEQISASFDKKLDYVKPHGALYNDSAINSELALAICEAIAANFDINSIMGLPNSEHERAAKQAGLHFIPEAFVDRAYAKSGLLKSRSEVGAVHETEDQIVQQALLLARKQHLNVGAANLHLQAQSLCIHGDTPHALQSARAIKAAFASNNIEISAS